MKKVLLLFLALIALMMHVHSIFANERVEHLKTEAKAREFEKEKQIIQHLFAERAVLWNKLYQEPKNLIKYSQKLEEIVAEPLLTFDKKAFQDAVAFPTDLEKIMGVEVFNIENVAYGRTGMEAEIDVLWKMEGLYGNYEEQIRYRVILKKENESWKLSDYTVSQ
ncbi:hypothetical protein [Thermotalea metallivorans]|uniref:DUF4829 domain-containing protein n=1 Tax=Thermotalea metallivorans TaxID=520762 RepID=A0A140L9F0_9FIRM|nr:hypothetical protein [Thermotalea metallivorans]KXG77175.1 hypothetical protein AN619_07050 [Thermotalea metallivorans]